jgi:hypothetical protein
MSEQGVKNKKGTSLIVKIIIIIVLVFAGYMLLGGGVLIKEKTKMKQYLEEKYGKEFVIERIGNYYKYLGAPKEIKGIAHPKDDKELKFEIRKSMNNKKYDFSSSLYWERYLAILWEKQTKEKVIPVLNTDIVLTGVSGPIREIYKNINGKTLSIDEVIVLYKSKISLGIYCVLFVKDEETDLSKEWLESLYNALESLKNQNYNKIKIDMRFINNSFKDDVAKDPGKYLETSPSEYMVLKNERIILYKILIENISNINQPDDIKKYIEN